MVELYKKLGEYGVWISMKADNDFQLVHIKFEKGLVSRWYVYTYETACDPVRWEDMLIGHLAEFMFIYEEECKKYEQAYTWAPIWPTLRRD